MRFPVRMRLLASVLACVAFVPERVASEEPKVETTFEQEWRELVPAQKESAVRYFDRRLRPDADRLASFFSFDEAQAQELEQLLESAIEDAGNAYMRACREALEKLDEEDRRQALGRARRGVFFPNRPNYSDYDPSGGESWSEGLIGILGEEGWKLWRDREERLEKDQWEVLLAQLLLLIDDAVGLSPDQRGQLSGKLRPLLRKEDSLQTVQLQSSVSERSFAAFFSDITHIDTIAGLLGDRQGKRFRSWAESISIRSAQLEVERPERRVGEARESYHERVIAIVVMAQKEANASWLRDLLLAEVDEIDRAVELTASQRAELELAAEGTLEYAFEGVVSSFESNVRRSIESIREGEPDERYDSVLGNLRVVRFTRLLDESLRTATRERVLDETQRERWEEVQEEKAQFENEVCLDLLRYRCESILGLREEQWEELEPLLVEAIEVRAPELERYLPATTPWFFHSQKAYYPFLGIEEKRFRSILTERQWDLWSAGPGTQAGRYENYIRTIREREEEQEAARKQEKEEAGDE